METEVRGCRGSWSSSPFPDPRSAGCGSSRLPFAGPGRAALPGAAGLARHPRGGRPGGTWVRGAAHAGGPHPRGGRELTPTKSAGNGPAGSGAFWAEGEWWEKASEPTGGGFVAGMSVVALRCGFLLLLLHILRAVIALEEKIIFSKLGDNATLSCIYQGKKLPLKSLRVYWQIADDQEECSVVHALISGQDNESEQCVHFKNRTQLFWDKLENGDFSLLLLNVSQSDVRTYKCVVLQKTEYTKVIHQAEVVLSLAASYSQPILSGPIRNSNSTGEEVTFSCRSGNGYPEPNVYWINKTDNSHLLPSELTITPHTDGTYSIFSTLKVKATSNMQIECSIENRILQENLSANYTQEKQSNGSSTESHKNLEKNGRGAQAAGVISIVILMGLLAGLTCWLWRRRSSKLASYTDVPPNEDKGELDCKY
ncbi:PREDICTED: ICOS ligand [Haliaeetus leucocephalus]|uniref:ICOS ligand n=1 Tax=Haliaeetus leucocephalus TaxID=52644 RepID=UPI00053CC0E2|nr:PREDICTED: ICOS ligand [Haliaeetus leucocephalus]